MKQEHINTRFSLEKAKSARRVREARMAFLNGKEPINKAIDRAADAILRQMTDESEGA